MNVPAFHFKSAPPIPYDATENLSGSRTEARPKILSRKERPRTGLIRYSLLANLCGRTNLYIINPHIAITIRLNTPPQIVSV